MNEFENRKRNATEVDMASTAEVEALTGNTGRVLDDGLGPMWMFWRRRRYLVIIMSFLGEVIKEVLRTNLSVAVFPMTENHSITDENGTTIYVQDIDMDVKTRGFLLSAFFYGFVTTIFLGGVLAVKYGGTRLYGLGVAVTAASTLLTPAAAYIHFYVLVALRIFEGMCEGILKPSLELIYANWIPLEERSSLVAIAATGNAWGVMLGMAISSAISYHCGWPSVFYITGGAGIAWYITWLIIVKNSPTMEKRISLSELKYIQCSLGKLQERKIKMSSIPFFKIFTSTPVLALMFSFLPLYCCYVMFSTQMPAYIKDVLKVDTQNTGYLSSLPFAAKVLAIYCVSPLADALINRKILTTTAARKIYICGCLAIMVVMSFLIQQVTSTPAVMAHLAVISICSGAAFVQVLVNMLDLAPKYSSVLSGIINTIASLCGMFVPVMVGYLTQNKTAKEWHTVFSIMGGACLLSAAGYIAFGSGVLQPWATENNTVAADTADEKRIHDA